jgi:hypothetical protein
LKFIVKRTTEMPGLRSWCSKASKRFGATSDVP